MPGPSAHRYPNAQLNPHTLLTPYIPPSNPATQVVQVVVVEKFLKDKDMQNHDCLGQSMNGTTYRGCVPVSAASVVAKKATKMPYTVLPHVIRNKRVGKGRRVDSVQSHSPLRNHRVSFTV